MNKKGKKGKKGPLEIIQIDHTIVDIVVLDKNKQPIDSTKLHTARAPKDDSIGDDASAEDATAGARKEDE